MTTEVTFDAAHPIADRYQPPACGEIDEIAKLLYDGPLSGGAPVLAVYERTLATWLGVSRAIATNSGSSALHASLLAVGVTPGRLVPDTAPLPTAMPILTCGAKPVIVDTLPASLALAPADVVRKLTGRTFTPYPTNRPPSSTRSALSDGHTSTNWQSWKHQPNYQHWSPKPHSGPQNAGNRRQRLPHYEESAQYQGTKWTLYLKSQAQIPEPR